MQFYTKTHTFYCGVDLHARSLYLCVLDADAHVRLPREIPATPDEFLAAIAPFRPDVVVAAECLFAWYWLADLCADQNIPFVLGRADDPSGLCLSSRTTRHTGSASSAPALRRPAWGAPRSPPDPRQPGQPLALDPHAGVRPAEAL